MCVIVGHLHIQSYSSIIYSNINIGSYWMYRLRSESQNPKNNIGAKLAGDLWSCPASVNVMEEESTETRQGKVATWPSPMEKMSYQVKFTIDFIWFSMSSYDFIWFYGPEERNKNPGQRYNARHVLMMFSSQLLCAHMRPALRRAPWVHWFGV